MIASGIAPCRCIVSNLSKSVVGECVSGLSFSLALVTALWVIISGLIPWRCLSFQKRELVGGFKPFSQALIKALLVTASGWMAWRCKPSKLCNAVTGFWPFLQALISTVTVVGFVPWPFS